MNIRVAWVGLLNQIKLLLYTFLDIHYIFIIIKFNSPDIIRNMIFIAIIILPYIIQFIIIIL